MLVVWSTMVYCGELWLFTYLGPQPGCTPNKVPTNSLFPLALAGQSSKVPARLPEMDHPYFKRKSQAGTVKLKLLYCQCHMPRCSCECGACTAACSRPTIGSVSRCHPSSTTCRLVQPSGRRAWYCSRLEGCQLVGLLR